MTTDVYETYIKTLKIGLNDTLENKLIEYIQEYSIKRSKIDKKNEKKKAKKLEELRKKEELRANKILSPRGKIIAIKNIMKNNISLSEIVERVCPHLEEDISKRIGEKFQSIKDRIVSRIQVNESCDVELEKIEFTPIKVGARYKKKETVRRKNLMYSKTYEVLEYIQSRIFSFICCNSTENIVDTIKNFTIDNGTKTNNLDTIEQKYYYSENLHIHVVTPYSNYIFLKNIKCKFNMLYNRKEEDISTFLVNGLYISKYYISSNGESLRKLIKLCKYENSKQEADKKICSSINKKLESEGIVGNKRHISAKWWEYSDLAVKPYLEDLDFINLYVLTS